LIEGRLEEAIDWQDKALHEHSGYVPALIYKIVACAAAGRHDDARSAGRLLLQLVPGETIAGRMSIIPLRRPQDRELFVSGLRQAGVPE
jgi:hypothetical protein